VLIVDDGIATGATASVACAVARGFGAARVIVAAPVGARDAMHRIEGADQVICVRPPADFRAVGEYYRHFEPATDAEVAACLAAQVGS
jgi:putative phosphoribosyl transferase